MWERPCGNIYEMSCCLKKSAVSGWGLGDRLDTTSTMEVIHVSKPWFGLDNLNAALVFYQGPVTVRFQINLKGWIGEPAVNLISIILILSKVQNGPFWYLGCFQHPHTGRAATEGDHVVKTARN